MVYLGAPLRGLVTGKKSKILFEGEASNFFFRGEAAAFGFLGEEIAFDGTSFFMGVSNFGFLVSGPVDAWFSGVSDLERFNDDSTVDPDESDAFCWLLANIALIPSFL
jgi:hypothetical protein